MQSIPVKVSLFDVMNTIIKRRGGDPLISPLSVLVENREFVSEDSSLSVLVENRELLMILTTSVVMLIRCGIVLAFMAVWKEAYWFSGTVVLLIPKGKYIIGPIKFTGPCNNVFSLIVRMKGYLKATTDLSKYGSSAGWVESSALSIQVANFFPLLKIFSPWKTMEPTWRLVKQHLYKALNAYMFNILDIIHMSELREDAHPSTAGGKKRDDCMH